MMACHIKVHFLDLSSLLDLIWISQLFPETKRLNYTRTPVLFAICLYDVLVYHFFQIFMRAHFSYNPLEDPHTPCRDAGLQFNKGDILEIVDMNEPKWWQVSSILSPQVSS